MFRSRAVGARQTTAGVCWMVRSKASHDPECGADQMIKNAGRDGNEAIARHPVTITTLGGDNCHKRSAHAGL